MKPWKEEKKRKEESGDSHQGWQLAAGRRGGREVVLGRSKPRKMISYWY